jgi:O-antigen/teichoic acid export membrane protein
MTVAKKVVNPQAGLSESGLKRRLLSNYFFQLLNQGLRILDQFLLVPLFILAWGESLYRDWLLIYAIASFATVCNLGTESHFGNLFLKSIVEGDDGAFRRHLRVGLFCTVTISAAILALFFGVAALGNLPDALGLTTMGRRAAYTALICIGLPGSVLISQQLLQTVYRAFGDFSRGECVFAIYAGTQTCSVAIALLLKLPPERVALCYLIVPVLFAAAQLFDLSRRYKLLPLALERPKRTELPGIAQQSLLYFTYPLSLAIVQNATIVLFAVLKASAAVIVSYNVFRIFTGMARTIANQFAVGGGIEMARQLAGADRNACRILYNEVGRIVATLVGLASGLSIPLSAPFLALWTHGTVAGHPVLLLAFLGGIFAAAPGQAALMLLRYTGHPRPLAVAWLVQSAGGLAVAFGLFPLFGAAGVALGFAATEALATGLWLPFVVQHCFGFRVAPHLLRGFAAGALSFAASLAVAVAVFSAGDAGHAGLAALLVKTGLWAAIIGPPALLAILTPQQRERLRLRLHQLLWRRALLRQGSADAGEASG